MRSWRLCKLANREEPLQEWFDFLDYEDLHDVHDVYTDDEVAE